MDCTFKLFRVIAFCAGVLLFAKYAEAQDNLVGLSELSLIEEQLYGVPSLTDIGRKVLLDRPDSAKEYKSYGFTSYSYNWHFMYNPSDRTYETKRYRLGLDYENEASFDEFIYNSEGQIMSNSHYAIWIGASNDTTQRISYLEEYSYTDSSIASVKGHTYEGAFQNKEYLLYDELGRISIHVDEEEYEYDSTLFYYNSEQQISHTVNYTEWGIRFEKYFYVETDSSMQTQVKRIDTYLEPLFDTIMNWDEDEVNFTKYYDSEGRVVKLEYANDHYNYNWNDNVICFYHINYKYDVWGNLTELLYSTAKSESDAYENSHCIKQFFDSENRLTQIEKTFYDERIFDWSIYENMNYFYPSTLSTPASDEVRVKIVPNPSSNFITIENTNSFLIDYRIIDNSGNIVIEGQTENSRIEVYHLPTGVYFLYLNLEECATVRTFIKH